MGPDSVPILFYPLAIYIAVRLLSSWINENEFKKFARKNGASRPPKEAGSWIPWGIGPLYKAMKGISEGLDIFEDIVSLRFRNTGPQPEGCLTFESPGLGGTTEIETIDSRNVQAIFSTKFDDWEQGVLRYNQFGVVLGRGIFTSDGSQWQHFRHLLQPSFATRQLHDLQDVDNACKDFVAVLPRANAADHAGEQWTDVVDVLPLNYRFTLDTSTGFLFGRNIGSQLAAANMAPENEALGEATKIAADVSGADMKFADAFQIAQMWMGTRIRLQGFYWMSDGFVKRRAKNYVLKFVDHFVQQAFKDRERMQRTKKSKNDTRSLLDDLVDATQDMDEIRNQVLGVLVAARDTTSNMLSWLFLELARNPAVYDTLRTAILSSFGTNQDALLNVNKLKSCKYLQYCLNEALRLHPVVPINNRFAVRHTILPAGGGPDGQEPLAVRKGEACTIYLYTMQRLKTEWGPDADEFKPERWESKKAGWNFVPFSSGPRVCLGQQMALAEGGYLVARLVQIFDKIEWMGPLGRPKNTFGITLCPAAVPVRFRFAK